MVKYYAMDINGREADIYIFGDIVSAWETGLSEAWDMDFGEASGLSIANEIKALDVDTINVHINSMGGDVAEGLAIYNTLKNHNAKIVTYCDGFACSAASVVFMAGDERIMSTGTMLMIHNAWVTMSGNANELRKEAETLEKISKAMSDTYADKINISAERLQELLTAESWLNADEAVEMGFATKAAKAEKVSSPAASVRGALLAKISNAPVSCETSEIKAADLKELNGKIDDIMAKLSEAKPQETPQEKNPTNFLNALTGRKD